MKLQTLTMENFRACELASILNSSWAAYWLLTPAFVLADLLRTFSNTQFILTTHSPFVVEALNNHLKRGKLGELPTQDKEIDSLIPLSTSEVRAYLMENGAKHFLIDEETGLVDDALLEHFNQIKVLYDRMRDFEWNRKHD
jgi:hypothetical protein